MRAAVIKESHEVSVVSVEDPAPGPREVVVDVAACGICGTDLHILDGEFAPSLPIVPGHEFAGVVVATGTDVTELAEGQRVAVDPSLYCFECHYCRLGRGNLCERWNAIGVSMPGGAAEFAVAPVANCVPLADHVRLEDAALIEPLSCAIRGYDVLRSQLGAHILIYGSGTMGLMMLELAKRTGAASVDVVNLNPDRLATAVALGCSRTATSADELDQPRGWELVIDATGAGPAIQDGLPGSARAARSCSSAWRPTTPGSRSSPTGSTTRKSPSPAPWPSCTASSGPRSCSPTGCSTRTCSSATGSRWRTTPGRSTGSSAGSAARSRSSPKSSRDRAATPRPGS